MQCSCSKPKSRYSEQVYKTLIIHYIEIELLIHCYVTNRVGMHSK